MCLLGRYQAMLSPLSEHNRFRATLYNKLSDERSLESMMKFLTENVPLTLQNGAAVDLQKWVIA